MWQKSLVDKDECRNDFKQLSLCDFFLLIFTAKHDMLPLRRTERRRHVIWLYNIAGFKNCYAFKCRLMELSQMVAFKGITCNCLLSQIYTSKLVFNKTIFYGYWSTNSDRLHHFTSLRTLSISPSLLWNYCIRCSLFYMDHFSDKRHFKTWLFTLCYEFLSMFFHYNVVLWMINELQ